MTKPLALLLAWPALAAAQPDAGPPPPEEPHDAGAPEEPAGDPETDLRLADLEARLAAVEEENRRLSTLVAGKAAKERSRFDLYGFTDFTVFGVQAFDEHSLLAGAENPPALYFGHLNLYTDFRPSNDWRVLAELRFTYEPNGQETAFESTSLGTHYTRTSTRVSDSVSGRPFLWGGVSIERAHVDWTPSDRFGLRVGVFLTPFGIWNVDHGTPVLISARAPLAVLSAPFPDKQLGVQAFGALPLGKLTLDYALYVTNGRSDIELQADRDAAKAFGARAALGQRGHAVYWEVGASAWRGTDADVIRTLELDPLRFDRVETVQADVTALGLDLRLEWERWQVFAEGFYGLTKFARGKRRPQPALGGTQPDSQSLGGYVLAAYRLPLDPIDLRPFAAIDVVDVGGGTAAVFGRLLSGQLGLNWHVTPQVVVKGDLTRLWDVSGRHPLGFSLGDARYYDLQLAVAF
jgi:hypothetical protein